MNEEELEVGTLRSKEIQNRIQKKDPKGGSKRRSKQVYGAIKENQLLTVTSKFLNL